MKRLTFFFLSAILCSCSTKWADVQVNEKYALQLPSYLEPGNFSKDASLQYQNTDREFYIMMIDEDKTSFAQYGLDYDLNTYTKVAIAKYDSTGKIIPQRIRIGKDSARVADIPGSINGNDVFFKTVTIESPTRFYKINISMMGRDKEKYAPDVERILNSFRELKK
ncbi:MAG: hypothetical protein ACHQRM_11695 [Bacteroidia bacterium]